MKKDELEYRSKEIILLELASIYKKYKFRIDLNDNYYSIKEGEPIESYYRYVRVIDLIISKLSSDTKIIILNDFFEDRDNKWYLEYFTKSTYYRLKKKAVNEFINCLPH